MIYRTDYDSPLGRILLAADEAGLTSLWFYEQKYFPHSFKAYVPQKTLILTAAEQWLDTYFCGEEPDFTPPLHPIGTDFQKEVWDILLQIPYGQTTTYGDIAAILAKRKGVSRMSAQAVGSAVGHNNISILIPCHRVVGKSGSLTGYAGGVDKKLQLLQLEKVDVSQFFIPKKRSTP